MYVKKEELRAAIVTRIEHVRTNAPERVKTANELRDEVYALEEAFRAERATIMREHIRSGAATFTRVTVDHWKADQAMVTVDLPTEIKKTFNAREDAIQVARQLWHKQSELEGADRRKRHGRYGDQQPTSIRELEAWLVRLDNDVKTATVNINKQFAAELGLV